VSSVEPSDEAGQEEKSDDSTEVESDIDVLTEPTPGDSTEPIPDSDDKVLPVISAVGGGSNNEVYDDQGETPQTIRTWTGTASNLWDVDANWGGTKPVAGDDLVFPASASNKSTSNNFPAGTSFNSITFEGTGYTLATNSISLPAGGITSNISGGSNTISFNIALTATTTIAVTNSNETLTISGIISSAAGVYGINKTLPGTLTLSGSNTFTGGLVIKEGTVKSGQTSANALGGSGTGQVILGDSAGGSNNATLTAVSALTFANPIVLASNTTGTLAIGGQVAGCDITFSGGITGTNNLVFNSTFTNGCGLTFSTGSINNTGTITNSSTGSKTRITINSIVSSNVTEVIQNSSTGSLTLAGDNADYAGGVTILKGTVALSTNANAAGTGTITIGNSAGGSDDATLQGSSSITFSNPIVLASDTTGILTISKPEPTFSPVFSGGVTGTNDLAINAGGTSGILIFSTGSINNTGTVTNSGSGTVGVTISSVIGSNVTEVIQNSSTSALTLSGANTFTGNGLTILKGTVRGTTSANAFGTGSVTLGNSAGGSDDANLEVGTSGLTFANPIVLASNTTGTLTVKNLNSVAATFTGGVTGTNDFTINNVATSDSNIITFSTGSINNVGTITSIGGSNGNTTISSVIGTNVTEVIQNRTLITSGILTLSGNNTFDGLTILKGTVIGSTSANAFGTGSVTLGNSAGGSDDARLAAGTGSLTFANPIILASDTTGTLTIENKNGNNSTFTGGITGNNNFSINNSASSVGQNLTFATGAINNSGTITNVSAGNNNSLSVFITAPIGSNVTGIIQNSAVQPLTVSGEITVNSSGTTLTNSATTRTLTISGGVVGTGNLIINNDSTTASGITISTTDVNNVGTITNSGTGTGSVALSSVVGSNVTGLTQNSATSQLTLSGNDSTISGDVTITSGTLQLSGTTNLNVSGNWTNNSTFTSNTGTVTFIGSGNSTVTSGGTGTTQDFNNFTVNKTGSGVVQLSTNDLDVDGTLTVTDGTLDLNGQSLSTVTTCSVTDTLKLTGDETLSCTPTLNTNSIVEYSATSGTRDIKNWTYDNLVFNGTGGTFTTSVDETMTNLKVTAGTLTLTNDYTVTATTTIDGGTLTATDGTIDAADVTISSGTLTAPTGTFTVSGNFSNSGTFTPNEGTVTLDGTDQTISGSTSFYKLSKEVATSDTLTFEAESTQTIGNTLTLKGALGELLSLRSTVDGTPWKVDPEGTRDIEFLDVKDSNNINATAINCISLNCTDSTGNTNWTFVAEPDPEPEPDSSGGGSSSGGFFDRTFQQREPEQQSFNELIDELLKALSVVKGLMPPSFETIFLEPDSDGEVLPIPIEELVSEEAPLALRGQWRLIPQKPIYRFVLAPLPGKIKQLAQKFPEFGETLRQVGITKVTDLKKLQAVKITLPGLGKVRGDIPTEVVFAGAGFSREEPEGHPIIDIPSALYVSEQGEPQQKINVIASKPLLLSLKPDAPANGIKGFLVFKSRGSVGFQISPVEKLSLLRGAKEYSGFKFVASTIFASPVIAQTYDTQDLETRLVLLEFDYIGPDEQGLWTADIKAPVVDGEYEIISVIEYRDPELGQKAIRLITVVDPEGYVYEKSGDRQIRIPGAIVSLFWLNPETKEYQMWPAQNYQQENSQITDVTGRYSFLVAEGTYYLVVEAPGYPIYQGKVFQVREGAGVHENIELRAGYWWLRVFDWKSIVLIIFGLLLFYNFYRDRVGKQNIKI